MCLNVIDANRELAAAIGTLLTALVAAALVLVVRRRAKPNPEPCEHRTSAAGIDPSKGEVSMTGATDPERDIDEKFWKAWNDAIKNRSARLAVAELYETTYSFALEDDAGNKELLSLRSVPHAIVGIDIVGYSRRTDIGRVYLTTLLFGRIDQAVRGLEKRGWISRPVAILPTGDGAYVTFRNTEDALAFTFALQMFAEDANRGPYGGVEPGANEAGGQILPFELRFALVSGRLVFIRDVIGNPNFVGEGLVKCARSLATSKGAHFLVDGEVMAWALQNGGLNEIARLGGNYNWGQRFNIARLQPRSVKGATYDLWNVFGTFNSRALMSEDVPAEFRSDVREYSIGSHDLTALI